MQKEMPKFAIVGLGMASRAALRHYGYLIAQGKQYAKLVCVTASENSVGKTVGESFDEKEKKLAEKYPGFWEPLKCPEIARDLVIQSSTADAIIANEAKYVISAPGGGIAKNLEAELVRKGIHTISNDSAFRWDEKVPLLIPDVNLQHIKMIDSQDTSGKQICNPNCTVSGYAQVIKVLEESGYLVDRITLTTNQAISGKGDVIMRDEYASSIKGNIIDDWTDESGINKEALKSAVELQKILGRVKTKEEVEEEMQKILIGEQSKIIQVIPRTTRIAVQYGHTEHLVIDFKKTPNDEVVDINKIRSLLENYKVPENIAKLPSTPDKAFIVYDKMPSPKNAFSKLSGMEVLIGGIEKHNPKTISFTTLVDNTIRGATGSGMQCFELLLQYKEGFFRD